MSNLINVAAIQLKPASSLEDNLTAAAALLFEAAAAGAQLAVLPENFAHYGQKNFTAIGLQESTDDGPVRQFLADQARLNGLWLVGGSLPVIDAEPLPFARSLLFDPAGNALGQYDKIHLFDVDVGAGTEQAKCYKESDDFAPGTDPVVAATALCTLGMTVCYDLRFAELYRKLADEGAQVITVPAAFTAATGKDHWQVLLRARAIENQVFVIGANLVDRDHPSRGLWGGSAIIDPWGTVLASLDGDESGVVTAEIDLGMIAELRAKMPIGEHRKLFI
ncbi:carbon-nitrogen hydrolase family protein [Porticoccaceae bacterium]|jgi:nitrilase|nr:carbon-nitrogen hydrolase family protein [Porticoccaceae bacterium]